MKTSSNFIILRFLTGSGLCDADQVPAGHGDGPGLRLDDGRLLEALMGQFRGDVAGKADLVELEDC